MFKSSQILVRAGHQNVRAKRLSNCKSTYRLDADEVGLNANAIHHLDAHEGLCVGGDLLSQEARIGLLGGSITALADGRCSIGKAEEC